jgi:hypothetical protein
MFLTLLNLTLNLRPRLKHSEGNELRNYFKIKHTFTNVKRMSLNICKWILTLRIEILWYLKFLEQAFQNQT